MIAVEKVFSVLTARVLLEVVADLLERIDAFGDSPEVEAGVKAALNEIIYQVGLNGGEIGDVSAILIDAGIDVANPLVAAVLADWQNGTINATNYMTISDKR